MTLARTDNERGGGDEGHVPLNNGFQAKGRSFSLCWTQGQENDDFGKENFK